MKIEWGVEELLRWQPPARLSWTTGFDRLDAITGGFERQQVWVITGEPAVGKTVLLTQWAYLLAAEHRFRTVLFGSSRDGLATYRHWLLNRATHTRHGRGDLEDPRVRSLLSADLMVSASGFGVPRWADAGVERRALLLDAPEGKRDPILDEPIRDQIRATADAGATVLVTCPRRHCLEEVGDGRTRLREEWSATADIVVDLVPTNPDLRELQLVVRQNRHGPCDSQEAALSVNGHIVQVVDETAW